jgi:hypothetical protein
MKNKTFKSILVMAMVAFVSGCSTTYDAGENYAELKKEKYELEVEKQKQSIESIPDWFLEPLLSNESGFYAVGSGKAHTFNSALRKAQLRAQVSLAGNVSQLITAQEKMFSKSSVDGDGETLQTAIESFIQEQDVAGTEFDRTEVASVGTEFAVYVRAFLPVKDIKAAKDKLKFANDLALESEKAQRELMLRVQKAKDAKLEKDVVDAAKIQAEADKKASDIIALELGS